MRILTALAALALFSAPALAQNSKAISESNSDSVSVANVTQTHNIPRTQRIHTTGNAFAPGLAAAGVHSCAGSTSGGVGGSGFGFSFGSTWEMQECNRRAYAATLAGMGQHLAALDLICRNPEVASSLNNTGIICPHQRAVARTGAIPAGYVANAANVKPKVVSSKSLGGPRKLRAMGCKLVPGSHWDCPPGVL